jgi:hypothetical protein
MLYFTLYTYTLYYTQYIFDILIPFGYFILTGSFIVICCMLLGAPLHLLT